jgi:type IV fimbrial biogenesis protein FimT
MKCRSSNPCSVSSHPGRTGLVFSEKPSSTRNGFTVIELLVALAVAAILLTVGVPNLRTFVQNAQTTSTADSFLAAIQRARSEAITRGDAVLLCRTADPSSDSCGTSATEDWTGGWLMYAVRNFAGEVNYDNTDANHDLIRRGTPAPQGVEITSDDHGNNWLTFGADGSLVEDGTAAYAICDDRGEQAGKLVVIPMVGRPYTTKDMTDAPNCEPT